LQKNDVKARKKSKHVPVTSEFLNPVNIPSHAFEASGRAARLNDDK
jgi:hypothetical protein